MKNGGKITKLTSKEDSSMLMVTSTKENGKMIKPMAKKRSKGVEKKKLIWTWSTIWSLVGLNKGLFNRQDFSNFRTGTELSTHFHWFGYIKFDSNFFGLFSLLFDPTSVLSL